MSAPKRSAGDLALLGGQPAFTRPLPVGQLFMPPWERYEAAMRGIFERGWYTNHGPLAQELEERLAAFFGVRHAVTVTNATLGLAMVARALDLSGKVVVPGFTFIATAQAMSWAGLDVAFCDVDPETHHMTVDTVAPHLGGDVSAMVGVNLWGGACDVTALERLGGERGISLLFDSAHAAGAATAGRPLGGFGRAEVFSFHATKVLSATEGGCITTDDDELAARIRNIRSSYGAGPAVAVPLTGNGRFSEAQAAIALMSLEEYPTIRLRNRSLIDAYRGALSGLPGVRLVEPVGVDSSNHQYAVVEVDEGAFGVSRDTLMRALHAENVIARRYFYPGVHRCVPYVDRGQPAPILPGTDGLCGRLLQLPVGALVTEEKVAAIAELIAAIRRYRSPLLREAA